MLNIRKLKLPALVLMLALLLSMAACGGSDAGAQKQTEAAAQAAAAEETAAAAETEAAATAAESAAETMADTEADPAAEGAGGDVLVVYFSATGTTKGVAEKIAAITGADTYQILAAQEYSSDDLNWNDSNSRSTLEQNDSSARPEIGSDPVSLEGYKTIYIGYPIWWGEAPRIMDTFVESYDFDGITMIPFCTSSSSGVGRSGKILEENAGSGNWLEGQRFGGGVSEEELQEWIDSLQ